MLECKADGTEKPESSTSRDEDFEYRLTSKQGRGTTF